MPNYAAESPAHRAIPELVSVLEVALEQILRSHPAGLSEHALLKILQSPDWNILEAINFREPAALYPVHFLVFHALYRLRTTLISEGGETLHINALNIILRPGATPSGTSLPDHGDPLAEFYLDLNNLRLESNVIESMLDDFWQGIQRPSDDALKQACDDLELDWPPQDARAANLQFRRLAMLHHPDRGGKPGRLQSINHAIAVVRRHLRHAG